MKIIKLFIWMNFIFLSNFIYAKELNEKLFFISHEKTNEKKPSINDELERKYLNGVKISSLPFDEDLFNKTCLKSKICEKKYFLYTVTKVSKNPISKLVGSYNYTKGNINKDISDYSNPVSNGLNPTYIIFPPYGQVIIVRVFDNQQGDRFNREGLSGRTYLTIKNGKIIDHFENGCDILDDKYHCINNGVRQYKISELGVFEKIN